MTYPLVVAGPLAATLTAPVGTVPSPSVTLHTLVTGWQAAPLALVAVAVEVAAGAAYLVGVARLSRRGRRWDPWRTAAFVGGLGVVALAVDSGIAAYDDSVFVMHVVQHLMLMTVAPVLIALGAPVTLVLQAGGRTTKRRGLAVLNSAAFRVLTFPVLVWLAFYGTMFAYFLTPLYAASLRHPLLHDLTHVEVLAVGVLYWLPMVGLDRSHWQFPYPGRLLSLATGIPFSAFLGIALMSVRTPISPAHTLADVQAGGGILWGVTGLLNVAALGVVVLQWSHHEERRAARADRRADQAASYDVELAAHRARLAVAQARLAGAGGAPGGAAGRAAVPGGPVPGGAAQPGGTAP